ncbi:MAG TPA: heavy metal-binding domain-containing protein, partial [Geobacteraceae bacterium]|nr:heavy metal-binding domain-containing protein [Geobacteraceae bacterium]
MSISKKVAIPLIVILLAAAGGGGYYLWHEKKAGKGAPEATKGEEGKVLYTCPMHPFIIKDKPGACPICGMTLVKKIEGAQGGAPS